VKFVRDGGWLPRQDRRIDSVFMRDIRYSLKERAMEMLG